MTKMTIIKCQGPNLDSKNDNVETTISSFQSLKLITILFYVVRGVILIVLGSDLTSADLIGYQLAKFIGYFLIGIFAAIVANSTGAGGGIVFLPVFMVLGLSPAESLATSLAIQCFGMSSGSLAWIRYKRKKMSRLSIQWSSFHLILVAGIPSSWCGIFFGQYLMAHPPINVELLFSLFSLMVGGAILFSALMAANDTHCRKAQISKQELAGIVLVCLVGGCITAWISIGFGELLAIYLLFIGFRINVAVASAVCVSAASVLIAVVFYVTEPLLVNLNLLVFAAPGALIGGALARPIATSIGAQNLKLAMSSWIILTSLIYLVPNLVFA